MIDYCCNLKHVDAIKFKGSENWLDVIKFTKGLAHNIRREIGFETRWVCFVATSEKPLKIYENQYILAVGKDYYVVDSNFFENNFRKEDF